MKILCWLLVVVCTFALKEKYNLRIINLAASIALAIEFSPILYNLTYVASWTESASNYYQKAILIALACLAAEINSRFFKRNNTEKTVYRKLRVVKQLE